MGCEDDTSGLQIFNRESFSLRGLVVGHRVHSTSGLPATLNFSVASGQGIYAGKVRTHARMCQEKPLRPTGIQAQCGEYFGRLF